MYCQLYEVITLKNISNIAQIIIALGTIYSIKQIKSNKEKDKEIVKFIKLQSNELEKRIRREVIDKYFNEFVLFILAKFQNKFKPFDYIEDIVIKDELPFSFKIRDCDIKEELEEIYNFMLYHFLKIHEDAKYFRKKEDNQDAEYFQKETEKLFKLSYESDFYRIINQRLIIAEKKYGDWRKDPYLHCFVY